jgi:hypothetical protein
VFPKALSEAAVKNQKLVAEKAELSISWRLPPFSRSRTLRIARPTAALSMCLTAAAAMKQGQHVCRRASPITLTVIGFPCCAYGGTLKG